MIERTFWQLLRMGETVPVGNKLYALCGKCKELICVNKFLFGSMHFCDPDPPEAKP